MDDIADDPERQMLTQASEPYGDVAQECASSSVASSKHTGAALPGFVTKGSTNGFHRLPLSDDNATEPRDPADTLYRSNGSGTTDDSFPKIIDTPPPRYGTNESNVKSARVLPGSGNRSNLQKRGSSSGNSTNSPYQYKNTAPPPDRLSCGSNCGTHQNAGVWLNCEGGGLFGASLSWSLMVFSNFTVTFVLVREWLGFNLEGLLVLGVFQVLWWMSLWCHIKTMLTDPGSVPSDAQPPRTIDETDPEFGSCHWCNAYKPSSAHHCSVCKRCIVKMDHHCPWVNNCVGVFNQKHFILFLCYTLVQCALVLCLIVWQYIDEPLHDFRSIYPYCIVMLAAVSILFGLFCAGMLVEQYNGVVTGLGGIDRLKGKVRSKPPKPFFEDVASVMGGGSCQLSWFLPIDISLIDKDDILQYVAGDSVHIPSLMIKYENL